MEQKEPTSVLRKDLELKQKEFYEEYKGFREGDFRSVREMVEEQELSIKDLKKQADMLQVNQETSGTLELKDMLRGPKDLDYHEQELVERKEVRKELMEFVGAFNGFLF